MSSTGHASWIIACSMALAGCLSVGLQPVLATNPVVRSDPAADATPRRTDPGADGPIDPEVHKWPDILSSSLGKWQPAAPATDLYSGQWDSQGGFFRLDLVLAGVVNPPGGLGCCGDPAFEPFRFGPNPVFGFIELDVDADRDTGGEVDSPDLRYTGNAARFGGLPQGPRYRDRMALDAQAFDHNLSTPPLVERSGEDFHIPLFGWEIDAAAITRSDPADWTFGPGETWIVPGYLFQRSHAYRQFSSACCRSGAPMGSYEPRVSLRFQHDLQSDVTTISLVYPLTNTASAAMRGETYTQYPDPFFTNQNSVREAIFELHVSALFASSADREEPEFALMAGWETKNIENCLDPSLWEVSVLIGGSYTSQQTGSLVVWSDVSPDVLAGDLQGSGAVDCADKAALNQWLRVNDGLAGVDADGYTNGRVLIVNVGPNFSLCDVNSNGQVGVSDRNSIAKKSDCHPGDFDDDHDVDQSDFGHFQTCFTDEGQTLASGCATVDMDGNLKVDQNDVTIFTRCVSGSGVPANPECDVN